MGYRVSFCQNKLFIHVVTYSNFKLALFPKRRTRADPKRSSSRILGIQRRKIHFRLPETSRRPKFYRVSDRNHRRSRFTNQVRRRSLHIFVQKEKSSKNRKKFQTPKFQVKKNSH